MLTKEERKALRPLVREGLQDEAWRTLDLPAKPGESKARWAVRFIAHLAEIRRLAAPYISPSGPFGILWVPPCDDPRRVICRFTPPPGLDDAALEQWGGALGAALVAEMTGLSPETFLFGSPADALYMGYFKVVTPAQLLENARLHLAAKQRASSPGGGNVND